MTILFKILFYHQLRINLTSKGRIIANILYFIVFFSIFQILTQNLAKNQSHELLVISTILSILLAIICINNDFLGDDYRDGSLEQAIIFCPNLEIYFSAKCLANWLSSCLPIIASACLIYQIEEFSIGNLGQLFLILVLGSLALSFLLALCEILTTTGILSSIIFILALPLALPILIIMALCFSNFENNITILSALTILIISISSVAGAKLIKIINC